MATRSLVSLRGFIEGISSGVVGINPTDIQNNTPPQFILQDILANGDNQVIVPALAKGVVIIFDPTSTVVKTLKGIVGDTGIVLAKNSWNVLTFDTVPPVDFYINCTGADTGKYTTILFF